MGVCCVSAEVLYLCALALSDSDAAAVRGMAPLADVLPETLVLSVPIGFRTVRSDGIFVLNHRASLATQVAALMLPGFLIKQWANVAQLLARARRSPSTTRPKERK